MRDICCYIIYSDKLGKFYVGICQESLDNRIAKHNDHTYGSNRFTSAAEDWMLFLRIDVPTADHARRIELKIKSMKSSVYKRDLLKYPELIAKIVIETK